MAPKPILILNAIIYHLFLFISHCEAVPAFALEKRRGGGRGGGGGGGRGKGKPSKTGRVTIIASVAVVVGLLALYLVFIIQKVISCCKSCFKCCCGRKEQEAEPKVPEAIVGHQYHTDQHNMLYNNQPTENQYSGQYNNQPFVDNQYNNNQFQNQPNGAQYNNNQHNIN